MHIIRQYLLSLITASSLLLSCPLQAQQLPALQPDPPKDWYALDPKTDGYMGISLKQAYQFLQGKQSKPVIVAIIDSGIDTLQQDIQGVLWANPVKDKDFPGDVHGWNFLGGPGRRCDFNETSEEVRQYFKLKDKYAHAIASTDSDKKEYAFWLQVKTEYDATIAKAKTELPPLNQVLNALVETSGFIRHELGLKDNQTFSRVDLEKIVAKNDTLLQIKNLWMLAFSQDVSTSTNVKVIREMSEYVTKLNNDISPDLDARKRIIGDDPDKLHDRFYGNNQLKFEDSSHGTEVAGLVGAKRGNSYGIDGIADNVQLMIIKAVPLGDEYDKDEANAIRFAVDHGARIINMSFGKKVSPHKEWLDSAFQYASAHNVLLVQASGNENLDLDKQLEYPNDHFLDGSADGADNVLNVGASGLKADTSLATDFSNFGKQNVDLFAPGVKITSIDMDAETTTDDGTSFSSPIVAGVAALIMEYYPDLNVKQVKQAIMQSVVPLQGLMVYKPGTHELVDFSSLSRSGGIVNAYRALDIASKMVAAGK